jgi:hypothetical protein
MASAKNSTDGSVVWNMKESWNAMSTVIFRNNPTFKSEYEYLNFCVTQYAKIDPDDEHERESYAISLGVTLHRFCLLLRDWDVVTAFPFVHDWMQQSVGGRLLLLRIPSPSPTVVEEIFQHLTLFLRNQERLTNKAPVKPEAAPLVAPVVPASIIASSH